MAFIDVSSYATYIVPPEARQRVFTEEEVGAAIARNPPRREPAQESEGISRICSLTAILNAIWFNKKKAPVDPTGPRPDVPPNTMASSNLDYGSTRRQSGETQNLL
eukprot:GFYU01003203.1.p1 GENE.GFYU01003203.1~~GFYU01003203.1.p1  ORF type:complete len:106 (-),score=22.88 GFYU01003203.1:247-564(-)